MYKLPVMMYLARKVSIIFIGGFEDDLEDAYQVTAFLREAGNHKMFQTLDPLVSLCEAR